MNLSLSTKLRSIKPSHFFDERVAQPCWYISLEKSEKRRQYKWTVGVKWVVDTEEHSFGLTAFDLNDEQVWAQVTSYDFAQQLLNIFKAEGKQGVKSFLKEVDV
jgi:hypothetical protein